MLEEPKTGRKVKKETPEQKRYSQNAFPILKNSQKRQDKRRAPKIYKKTCHIPPRLSHSDAIFFFPSPIDIGP